MNKSSAELALEYREAWRELGSWDLVGQRYGKPGNTCAVFWHYWKDKLGDPSIKVDNVIQLERPETDHDTWKQQVDALGDTYRVAFVSDFHIPDHDPRALNLAIRIVADFHPHLLVNGGDAFDFATIGRWEVDPDDLTTDAWQQINRPYLQLMRAFRDAAPDASSVFIVGNHDERVYKFFSRQAPQFRYTVNQLFVDMIRKSGALWLGWDATELQLPSLLLTHGTGIVSGVYPARRLADYCYGQVSALAGHCHKFDTWTRRGSTTTVTYQTNGCLCSLKPHYSNLRQNWQHGLTLVTVTNGVAFFEPVPFVDYRAVWSGKVYSV